MSSREEVTDRVLTFLPEPIRPSALPRDLPEIVTSASKGDRASQQQMCRNATNRDPRFTPYFDARLAIGVARERRSVGDDYMTEWLYSKFPFLASSTNEGLSSTNRDEVLKEQALVALTGTPAAAYADKFVGLAAGAEGDDRLWGRLRTFEDAYPRVHDAMRCVAVAAAARQADVTIGRSQGPPRGSAHRARQSVLQHDLDAFRQGVETVSSSSAAAVGNIGAATVRFFERLTVFESPRQAWLIATLPRRWDGLVEPTFTRLIENLGRVLAREAGRTRRSSSSHERAPHGEPRALDSGPEETAINAIRSDAIYGAVDDLPTKSRDAIQRRLTDTPPPSDPHERRADNAAASRGYRILRERLVDEGWGPPESL